MKLSILSQLPVPKNNLFYTTGFRQVLEQHLPLLRVHPETTRKIIEAHEIYQFEGDLYGLLTAQGIAPHMHWLIMRLNHMENAQQFGQHLHDPYRHAVGFTLLLPPGQYVEHLRKLYLTKKS